MTHFPPIILALLLAPLSTVSSGRIAPALPDFESTQPKLDYAQVFPPNPVRLPAILSDGMVLQRDQPTVVWGWGEPWKVITVRCADAEATTAVSLHAIWSLELPPLQAGGPHQLTATDQVTTATVNDVLVGDVWLCAGQSSMAQNMAGVTNAEQEIADASFPRIRLFDVPRSMGYGPQNDFPPGTSWQHCTPENVRRWSAVAYYFGRHLHRTQDVPIGLITSTWVNTTASAWTSPATNSYQPDQAFWMRTLRRTSTPPGRARLDDEARYTAWIADLEQRAQGTSFKDGWWKQYLPADRKWKRMKLPCVWEQSELGNYDGIVWFRREVKLGPEWEGRETTLSVGRIYDYDTTWFNGVEVGRGDDWSTTRTYPLPPGLVKEGSNTIAVRVLDTYLYGGIYGSTESLVLETRTEDGLLTKSLAGQWRYRPALNLKKAPPNPWKTTDQWPHPSAMYNAMIAPLLPYVIKGVCWYQGEADAFRGARYREMFKAVIRDYRNRWKQPGLPFVYAQIASIGAVDAGSTTSEWADVRESQSRVERETTATRMAVMYDLGGTTEPHYLRKREAGERLADAARVLVYGEDVDDRSPRYVRGSLDVKDGRARVRFDQEDLVQRGPELQGFMVAGRDRVWHRAIARLVEPRDYNGGTKGRSKTETPGRGTGTVEVWSEKVKRPVSVRFAWSDHPPVTLTNEAGLPAAPFRTDDWPLLTEGRL